jgi:hypothetical protein
VDQPTVAVPQCAAFRQGGGKTLRLVRNGAQRASRRSGSGRLNALAALLMALGCLSAIPSAASAATMKVVIVVGPVESMTSTYIYDARALARQARSYGAAVTEIYSPYATWSRVHAAAQGANLFIYLGHGNGWPSPYAPFNSKTKDGLGLNATSGSGNYNVKYYGEVYLANYIRLAPNAVVILNHLCYSAGNSESWQPNPTRSVARQRIDNYGAGFLRTGARVVFAEARNKAGYILSSLFGTNRTMKQIFWASPQATRSYAWSFTSTRTSGMVGISDPYAPSRYYRSVIGKLDMTAATWR